MRIKPLALGLALALALCAAPVVAQDPDDPVSTPAAICGVLTADEIAAVLGEELPVSDSSDTSCNWDALESNGTTSLSLSLAPGRLADLQAAFGDATSTEVAGYPALVGADGSFLFAEVEDGIVSLFLLSFGESGPDDPSAALLQLAEATLGRLPSISLPPPPTAAPEPLFMGDSELRDLFPDTVGGQPLEVQTLTGSELFGTIDPDDPDTQAELQAVIDLLDTQGKSVDDVSIGFGFFVSGDSGGGLTAFRVRGADVGALMERLLPMALPDIADPQRTTVQIAGREVIQITDGSDGQDGEPQYAYVKDDILWLVQATEPSLSELIGQLP
jgi:hypothetical protein